MLIETERLFASNSNFALYRYRGITHDLGEHDDDCLINYRQLIDPISVLLIIEGINSGVIENINNWIPSEMS